MTSEWSVVCVLRALQASSIATLSIAHCKPAGSNRLKTSSTKSCSQPNIHIVPASLYDSNTALTFRRKFQAVVE